MTASSSMINTLYVSLWHSFFYSSLASKSNGEGTLRLLEAVGFTKAGGVALQWQNNEPSLERARELFSRACTSDPSGVWPHRFFAACAASLLSSSGESSQPRESLEVILERLQEAHSQNQQHQQRDTEMGSAIFPRLAHGMSGKAEGAPDGDASATSNVCVFSLFDMTKAQVAASTDSSTHLFQEAKLYAALCLYTLFPAVKQLAKLLLVYIHQDDAFVSSAVFELEPQAAQEKERKHRTETRVRGVLAGLWEVALSLTRAAPQRLHATLDEVQATGTLAVGTPLPRVGPRPEQTAALLSSLVLTLVQLMTQANQLKSSAVTAGSSEVSSLTDGTFIGKEIIHSVQELLFTVVLGAGTVNMPNRPARSQQQQQQQAVETFSVVTHRPLTINEVDAITQTVFPSLLQHLGYEWPWSELLRHCRGLDKLQVSPTFPFVAQSSSLLIESVLLRVAARTYPQRLENILPESFDRLREKLGLLPRMNRGGEAEGAEADNSTAATKRKHSLFAIPAYYQEPVNALLAYYSRTKVGRLRVDEVERVLTIAVNTLPMTVQLRALAPPDESVEEFTTNEQSDSGKSTHGNGSTMEGRVYLLTKARVTALETRYKLECLLASVVVQTQLETHSQVQGMMRELAPLLSKLSLALSRHANALAVPLLSRTSSTTSSSRGGGGDSDKDDGNIAFTMEATKLMNDIGYQFYPLEWLPVYANAFHEHQERQHSKQQQQQQGIPALHASPVSLASPFPYSAYAAVAHQLAASFHAPLGTMSSNNNNPAGFRSTLTTPSTCTMASKAYLNGQTGKEEGGDGPDGAGGAMNRWKRATRLFEGLMLPCWLDARMSSCDLEGTMAVTATRVVGAAGSSSSGGGGAAAGGGQGDGLLARLSHLLKPRVQELFWSDENAGSAPLEEKDGSERRKRERDADEATVAAGPLAQRPKLTEKDEEAVRALTNALLRQGASSFELTMEAKDFVATVLQCFLPSTNNLFAGANDKKAKQAAPSGKVTAELMTAGLAWCQAYVGGNAVRADIRMSLQQQQQQQQQQRPSSQANIVATVYNSCTFDACSLARRVLLAEVPARLLEKLRARQQQTGALVARRERCLQRIRRDIQGDAVVNEEEEHNGKGASTAHGEVDKLLMHQWGQYLGLLRSIGLVSEQGDDGDSSSVDTRNGEVLPLTAAQWMWYSPYSTN